MLALRCLLCPAWRRAALNVLKPVVRNETTTAAPTRSAFSNIQKSFAQNVLVFEYKDRILPIIGLIGLAQFVVFDLIAYWSFHLFGTVTAKEENLTTNSTLIERAATIVPTKKFRYTTNIVIVLLSECRLRTGLLGRLSTRPSIVFASRSFSASSREVLTNVLPDATRMATCRDASRLKRDRRQTNAFLSF